VAALPVSAPSDDIWARVIHSQQESVIPKSSETARPVSTDGAPTEGSERKVEAEGVRNSKLKTGWGERVEKFEIRNSKFEIDPG
jgi:hypothetical protein